MKPPLHIGAITVEDMRQVADKMLAAGCSHEEVEKRLDEMADRNNRFSWAVRHPEDQRLALVFAGE